MKQALIFWLMEGGARAYYTEHGQIVKRLIITPNTFENQAMALREEHKSAPIFLVIDTLELACQQITVPKRPIWEQYSMAVNILSNQAINNAKMALERLGKGVYDGVYGTIPSFAQSFCDSILSKNITFLSASIIWKNVAQKINPHPVSMPTVVAAFYGDQVMQLRQIVLEEGGIAMTRLSLPRPHAYQTDIEQEMAITQLYHTDNTGKKTQVLLMGDKIGQISNVSLDDGMRQLGLKQGGDWLDMAVRYNIPHLSTFPALQKRLVHFWHTETVIKTYTVLCALCLCLILWMCGQTLHVAWQQYQTKQQQQQHIQQNKKKLSEQFTPFGEDAASGEYNVKQLAVAVALDESMPATSLIQALGKLLQETAYTPQSFTWERMTEQEYLEHNLEIPSVDSPIFEYNLPDQAVNLPQIQYWRFRIDTQGAGDRSALEQQFTNTLPLCHVTTSQEASELVIICAGITQTPEVGHE
jgi:hypothetical protein